MIKRLLIFFGLIGLGFVALLMFVEQESPLEAGPKLEERSKPELEENQQGIKSAEGAIQINGPVSIPRNRDVVLANGGIQQLRIYRLDALDSQTDKDGVLLEGVTIQFYRSELVGDDVLQVESGKLTASQARVSITLNSKEQLQVAEDKALEFWDAVFTTGDEGVIRNAKISIGHAKVTNTKEEVHLRTIDPGQLVTIVAQSDQPIHITGRGLDAVIPSSRDKKGDLAVADRGRVRLQVLSEPMLRWGNTELQSDDMLLYEEDPATGAATVSMRTNVHLKGLQEQDGQQQEGDELHAYGDHLQGLISRAGPHESTQRSWSRITLTGQTVKLLGQGNQLDCQRLDVLPDLEGNPYWITASGKQPKLVSESEGATFNVDGSVHLVQVAKQHSALLAAYGFPRSSFPKAFSQMVLFHGPTTVVMNRGKTGEDNERTELYASRGLTLLGSDRDAPSSLLGRGKIKLVTAGSQFTGNDGFFLQEQVVEGREEFQRTLRVGPAAAGADHSYELLREGLRLQGTGACTYVLTDREGSGNLLLTSTNDAIQVSLPEAGGELTQLHKLEARFSGQDGLQEFHAYGKSCRMSYKTAEHSLIGEAQSIHHTEAHHYRLHGNPARIKREEGGELRGQRLSFQHLGERDILVHASQGAGIHYQHEDGEDLELQADEITYLPYLVAPSILDLYCGRLPVVPRWLHQGMQGSAFVFAKGQVKAKRSSKLSGEALGEAMVVRVDQGKALHVIGELTGSPATLSSQDKNGKAHIAQAHRLSFRHDGQDQYLTMHPVNGVSPLLILPSNNAADGLALSSGATRVRCDGRIQVGPKQIMFLGPLTVTSVDQEGNEDPNGLQAKAKGMVMDRDPETGKVIGVHASNKVNFQWQGVSGHAEQLTIDVPNNLLSAMGSQTEPTVVLFPDGRRATVMAIDYNYRTKMVVGSWTGQFGEGSQQK